MQDINQQHNPNHGAHSPEHLDSLRVHIISAAEKNVLPFLPTEKYRESQEVTHMSAQPQESTPEPTIAPVLTVESARNNVANTLIIAEMEEQRRKNAA